MAALSVDDRAALKIVVCDMAMTRYKLAALLTVMVLGIGAEHSHAARVHHQASVVRIGTRDVPFVVEIAPTKTSEKDAAEHAREHQADVVRDRWMIGLTAALALATVILAIFTLLLWRETRRAVVGGQDALEVSRVSAQAAVKAVEMDHRPWVPGKLELREPCSIRDGLVVITIDVEMENTGRSPAFDVRCNAKLVASGMKAVRVEQKGIANNLRNEDRERLFVGYTLFPGQSQTIGIPMSIGWDDYGDGLIKGTELLPLSVVGCIAYRSVAGVTYETGFIYDVWHRIEGQEAGGRPIHVSEDAGSIAMLFIALDPKGSPPVV